MIFHLTPSARPDGYGESLLPLAACRAHLRIEADDDEEDELIGALRDAAVNAVEQYANLRMAPVAGMVATFAGFATRMRPGIGPAATMSVTGIGYSDSSGADQMLAPGDWRVEPGGSIMAAGGGRWPVGGYDVAITFDVGFPAGACPAGLIAAAKLMLGHLYANREAVVVGGTSGELPLGFMMLCDQHRIPVL